MLAAGDFYQLSPVGQSPVFAKPCNIKHPGDLAPLLWDDFIIHELDEVMPQKDIRFAHTLNKIHICASEPDSLEDILLRSCELTVPHTDPHYPIDAIHVYAMNEHCSNWNTIRLNMVDGHMYTAVATNLTRDCNTNLANMSFPTNPQETGNMVKVLNVKVGARVMLTTNIDVSDGLTNGAMGTVTGVYTANKMVILASYWLNLIAKVSVLTQNTKVSITT